MSKERLEELHKYYINGIINVDDLVQEVVKLEQLNGALINQNKRYREIIDKNFNEFWEACVKVVGEDTAYDIISELPEDDENE